MAFRILSSGAVTRIIQALTPRFMGRDQDNLLGLADEAAYQGYSAAYDYVQPLYAFKNTIESPAGASDVGITDVGSRYTSTNVEGALQEAANLGPVFSVFGRVGTVVAQSNDYTWAQLAATPQALVDISNISSPVNDDFIQRKAGAWTRRTAAQVRTDVAMPRVSTATSTATLTPDADSFDAYNLTAQAAALNVANPTGSPVPHQKLTIRIKDNATARAITWGTQWRGIGVNLPSTTVISKLLYVGAIYNSTDTKWDIVAVSQEA